MGGATYLASRFVFGQSNKKSLLFGVLAGSAIIAAIKLKINIPVLAPLPVVDKHNSPDLPETDSSKGNLATETFAPIVFNTGAGLENSVDSHLNDEAVTDWDIVWGDNPYKNQSKTINV